MRKIRLGLYLFAVALMTSMGTHSSLAVEGDFNMLSPSKIEIFSEGALLYFEMPSGEATVILPPTIDPNSISIYSDSGVNISKLEIDKEYLGDWIPSELGELKKQINSLQSKVAETASQLNALKQSAGMFETIPLPSDPRKAKEIISELQKDRFATEQSIFDLELKLEAQKNNLKYLQDQWNALSPTDDFAARVAISSTGKGEILLKAFSHEARWRPVYYANYDTKRGELTLDVKAEIYQKTGIPWNGKISLYTHTAKDEIGMPELPPLVVEFREPITLKALSRDIASFEQKAETRAEVLPGIVYTVDSTIAGTGKLALLPLEKYSEKTETEIRCLPQIDPEAWIIVQTKPIEKSLARGEVHLSIDNTPTGTSLIDNTSAGENLRFSLGKSPLVRATKVDLIPKTGEKWTKGTLLDGYDITVVNGLSQESYITIVDRIPVSSHQDIKVSNISIEPEPTETTQKGIYTWKLRLKQGETGAIKVRYEIKFPEDKEITIRPIF